MINNDTGGANDGDGWGCGVDNVEQPAIIDTLDISRNSFDNVAILRNIFDHLFAFNDCLVLLLYDKQFIGFSQFNRQIINTFLNFSRMFELF